MEPAKQQKEIKSRQQKHDSSTSITSNNKTCQKINDQNKKIKEEMKDNVAGMESSSSLKELNEDLCWICLDEEENEKPLHSPCGCPRKVHELCLARWQLQKAGKDEEQQCRFCKQVLPDWRPSLTPVTLKDELKKAEPTMMVTFRKQVCYVTVKPGPDGLKEFTNIIKEKFGLTENAAINVSFGCREPMSGNYLKLDGHGAFNAAVHCATVSAAARGKHNIKDGSNRCVNDGKE